MSTRALILAAVVSSALALPLLFPPNATFFVFERALLAGSRIVQGPVEFAGYSLLSIAGMRTPFSMFLSVAALSVLTFFLFRKISQATDELRDTLPALLLIYLFFGALSIYSGGVLVTPGTSCSTGSSQAPTQEVLRFDELGWQPGAHYFLITMDQATGQRVQARYARLDVPNDDPCGHIDEVFGP